MSLSNQSAVGRMCFAQRHLSHYSLMGVDSNVGGIVNMLRCYIALGGLAVAVVALSPKQWRASKP